MIDRFEMFEELDKAGFGMTDAQRVEHARLQALKAKQPHYNRFKDAVAIQAGACNPIAVAGSLVKAIAQCRALGFGTDQINGDAAVRMIVHQLAFLAGVGEYQMNMDLYHTLTVECEQRAANPMGWDKV